MAATVTYNFKDRLIDLITSDVDSSDNYYFIGIGRSQDWLESDGSGFTIPDAATDTLRSVRGVVQNLQSIKQIQDYDFVAKRHNWSIGSIYSAYDDDASGNNQTNPYYVITQDNTVYICLQQGKDNAGNPVTSTVAPTGRSTSAFKTADGYVWKFLYTVGAGLANRYLAANFIPTTFVDSVDSASSPSLIEQKAIQDAAIAGEVIGVALTDGGSGYTSPPTVTINGDGSGASAKAFVSGGSVTKIEIEDSDGVGNAGLQFGSGYNEASVTINGGSGSGATARAILGVPEGTGANPRKDLRSTAIMFNTKPDGAENGDFITSNDFRQVCLLKNPKQYDSDALFTDATGDALNKLVIDISTYTGTILPDMLIEQASSGAAAYVDKFDSDTIWYHQTEETGYENFLPAQQITYSGGSATLEADSATALLPPEIDIYSPEVMYYDNRAPVSRSDEQVEDIKLVIQF